MNVSLKLVTHKTPEIPCFDSPTGANINTLCASAMSTSPGNNFIVVSPNELFLLGLNCWRKKKVDK